MMTTSDWLLTPNGWSSLRLYKDASDRICPECDGPKSAYAKTCEECEKKNEQ